MTQIKEFNSIPAAVAFIDEFCADHGMHMPKNMFALLNNFDKNFEKPILLDRYTDGGRSENILEITLI